MHIGIIIVVWLLSLFLNLGGMQEDTIKDGAEAFLNGCVEVSQTYLLPGYIWKQRMKENNKLNITTI